jgi:hypothetical protein
MAEKTSKKPSAASLNPIFHHEAREEREEEHQICVDEDFVLFALFVVKVFSPGWANSGYCTVEGLGLLGFLRFLAAILLNPFLHLNVLQRTHTSYASWRKITRRKRYLILPRRP